MAGFWKKNGDYAICTLSRLEIPSVNFKGSLSPRKGAVGSKSASGYGREGGGITAGRVVSPVLYFLACRACLVIVYELFPRCTRVYRIHQDSTARFRETYTY